MSSVRELNNTLTMLSSEVGRICSSSVWEETSFCWNKKTVNEMIIIILSKTSTFSYWTGTCHVSKSLKNTLTMLSSDVNRICSSSVWEETSFCWNKKTVNEMITIILSKTSTFSYWTGTCHVSKNIKKYLNDVVVRRRQNLFLFRLGRYFFLLEQKDSK